MGKITNYAIQKAITPVFRADVYKIKKPNKFKRWLIKWLLKFNVVENDVEQKVEFKRVQIDRVKVSELIHEFYDEIYYNTGKEPRTVIIGYDKMRQLEIEMYDEMRFDMPIKLNGKQGQKIFGLGIILNPRIDGLVLI